MLNLFELVSQYNENNGTNPTESGEEKKQKGTEKSKAFPLHLGKRVHKTTCRGGSPYSDVKGPTWFWTHLGRRKLASVLSVGMSSLRPEGSLE